MSRLCRLKCNSHGEDGKWAYDEIVSLRKARDQLIEQFKTVLDENKTLKSALQHEVDVAEAYKAEADSLRQQVSNLTEQLDLSVDALEKATKYIEEFGYEIGEHYQTGRKALAAIKSSEVK
jgi:uncharacterized coiled-coil DUF342 family protein